MTEISPAPPESIRLEQDEEIKMIFYASKMKRHPKWSVQNIYSCPSRVFGPITSWTQDLNLPHLLKCTLTTSRIIIEPLEIDKRWLAILNASAAGMAVANISLNPHQMIQFLKYKGSLKKGIDRDDKTLEIALSAVEAAEFIAYNRKGLGLLCLKLVDLPKHLEREGGLAFMCYREIKMLLGFKSPYYVISKEVASCINSLLS